MGFRRFGVPPGGPYDRVSAAQAERLPGAVRVWEFFGPCRFEVVSSGMVGLAGAWRAPGHGTWAVTAGETLELGAATRGVFSYLAESPEMSEARWWPESPTLHQNPLSNSGWVGGRGWGLRFLPGPEADLFDLDLFCDLVWEATSAHSRLGLRLKGEPLTFSWREGHSEPQVRGTIQVPPNGLPVILGPDGPTVGGYAKLGVIVDADLDRVAQLAPGTPVQFTR